jgi:hypothetical protein|tara:strand:- start:225 stop:500 length:276 start_codon:yes stop_codon:yes gene_type:complete
MPDEWFLMQKKDENGEWQFTRVLTEEEARDQLRMIRQGCLEESDMWAYMDRWNSLTDAQQAELTAYRQALRDIPACNDPFNPPFPSKPSWM